MTGKRHPDNEDMGQRYTKAEEIKKLQHFANQQTAGSYLSMLLTPDLLHFFESNVQVDGNPDVMGYVKILQNRLSENEGDLNRAKQIIEEQQQNLNRRNIVEHDLRIALKDRTDKMGQLEKDLAKQLEERQKLLNAIDNQATDIVQHKLLLVKLKLLLFNAEHPELAEPDATADEQWHDLEDRDDEDEASHEW